jgi:hypothetical protein
VATFDIEEQNRLCVEPWKLVGKTLLSMGIVLAIFQAILIIIPLGVPHQWRLLTTDFGIVLWGAGLFAGICLWSYAIRGEPVPITVRVDPDLITFSWVSGKTQAFPWGRRRTRLTLFDASQTEIGRKLMKPFGRYMLRVPWSPISYALSAEAFKDILRIAHERGLDTIRTPTNPQLNLFFGDKVSIRSPGKAARAYS